MIWVPAKTQISLGIHPVWSVFAVRSMDSWGASVSSCRQWRLWSHWADAQADLRLGAKVILLVFVMWRLKMIKAISKNSENGIELYKITSEKYWSCLTWWILKIHKISNVIISITLIRTGEFQQREIITSMKKFCVFMRTSLSSVNSR